MKKRILFVSNEMQPYIKETEIAEISRVLPQYMQEKGMEIRVLMPRYGSINERRHRLHEVVRLSGINIVIGENDNPLTIKVASLPSAKMQVYFLDNEEYFQRKYGTRNDDGLFFQDNHERMIFFCKGVLETVNKLGWAPDIIHCNGWMTSLIPLYIKKLYQNNPTFKDAKVVYGLHEHQFNEKLAQDFLDKAVFEDMDISDFEQFKQLTNAGLDQAGIQYADGVVKHGNISKAVDDFLIMQPDKLVIDHTEENAADHYYSFYNKILSQQSVLI